MICGCQCKRGHSCARLVKNTGLVATWDVVVGHGGFWTLSPVSCTYFAPLLVRARTDGHGSKFMYSCTDHVQAGGGGS